MEVITEKNEAATIAVTNVSTTSLVNSDNIASTAPRTSPVPAITTSQSVEYIHRLAEITSRATLADPLNIVFQQEKTGLSTPVTPELLYVGSRMRTQVKVTAGAFVVEACNFAAVAVWEPPAATMPPRTEAELEEMAKERPIFAQFLHDIQDAEQHTFGGPAPPHWRLSLMARDPERKDKGAVRAVIEPFVARAKREKVPLWLIAGNPRARDVYAYFGFKVVRTVWSYPKGRNNRDGAVATWCMVCNWPLE
jgi:hypothetical protein